LNLLHLAETEKSHVMVILVME